MRIEINRGVYLLSAVPWRLQKPRLVNGLLRSLAKQNRCHHWVLGKISSGIGSEYWGSSSAALRPVEKSTHNRIELSAFLTITMAAAHCEYVNGGMTFISSRRFSFLSSSGSATYGTGRLGRKTGFSTSVASALVQRPRLLIKTGEKRFSISSVWSVMALWFSILIIAGNSPVIWTQSPEALHTTCLIVKAVRGSVYLQTNWMAVQFYWRIFPVWL